MSAIAVTAANCSSDSGGAEAWRWRGGRLRAHGMREACLLCWVLTLDVGLGWVLLLQELFVPLEHRCNQTTGGATEGTHTEAAAAA